MDRPQSAFAVLVTNKPKQQQAAAATALVRLERVIIDMSFIGFGLL
jgi:hypothetical protein